MENDGSIDAIARAMLTPAEDDKSQPQPSEDVSPDEPGPDATATPIEADADTTAGTTGEPEESELDTFDPESLLDAEPGEVDGEVLEDPDDQVFEYKANGQMRKATLRELKQAASAHAKIEADIEEASVAKKQVAENLGAVLTARQEYANRLEETEAWLAASLPPKPDPALREQDPIEYVAQKDRHDEAQAQLASVRANRAQIAAQDQAQAQAAVEEQQRQSAAALQQARPDLADPKKAAQFQGRIVKAAESNGYTVEEVAAVFDHRAFLVLEKAAKFDEIMANAKKKKAPVRAVNRPGARPSKVDVSKSKADELSAKAHKSHKVDDMAAWLLQQETG